MNRDNSINYRHEIKYRINGGTYHILRQRMKAVMKPDVHAGDGSGLYRVTSLYFDDVFRTAYRDKLNGVMLRKKYRIRVYDLSPEVINLEEKVKHNNVGFKKSVPLTGEQYEKILAGDRSFLGGDGYTDTAGGDFYVSDRAAALCPAVIVDYIREPYICEAGNVRVTFDMKISACVNSTDLFDPDCVFSTVMPDNDIILEVKYDRFIPHHILQLLTGVSAMQESVSKFVLCSDRAGILK